MRSVVVSMLLGVLLLACGKKPADVEGVWEVDVDASSESIAKDKADLALDPRMQRFNAMSRVGPTPGDRAELINSRKMEVRALLTDIKPELDFKPDGKVVMSTVKNGVREPGQPESWKLEDGKVVVVANTFTFEGKNLKGRILDGHPGEAVFHKRAP